MRGLTDEEREALAEHPDRHLEEDDWEGESVRDALAFRGLLHRTEGPSPRGEEYVLIVWETTALGRLALRLDSVARGIS